MKISLDRAGSEAQVDIYFLLARQPAEWSSRDELASETGSRSRSGPDGALCGSRWSA